MSEIPAPAVLVEEVRTPIGVFLPGITVDVLARVGDDRLLICLDYGWHPHRWCHCKTVPITAVTAARLPRIAA